MQNSLSNISVARTTTANQVAQALNDAILRGEMTPGARVRESALATQLGVSRNTVREAVRILGQSGLIIHEINRGAVIRPVIVEETQDLYRVRELLELSALDRVGKRTDLDPLRAAVDALRTAVRGGDVGETVERDLEFHGAIVALLESKRLDDFFADLRRQLRFYVAVLSIEDRETERPDALVEQHAAVLRALENGDRRLAKTLLRDHIRANAERICAVIRSRQAA